MSLPLMFGCSENEAFDNSPSNVLDVSTSQSQQIDQAERFIKISIGVRMELGRASRGCRGFGICYVKVDLVIGFNDDYGHNGFIGNIEPINPNKFILYVDQENMEQIISVNGGRHLILEESFMFNSETVANLNLAEDFTIGEGVYEFVQDPATSLYWVEISNNNN